MLGRGSYNLQDVQHRELGPQTTISSRSRARVKDGRSRSFNADFVDADGRNGVHIAILNHRVDASLLGHSIRTGCDVNAPDKYGQRPLHLAVERGFIHCANKLVKHKAEVNVFDMDDYSPVILAARHGFSDILSYLIKSGGVVNLANKKGELALHYAAASGHVACTEVLLRSGAKVNYPDRHGVTPLLLACRRKSGSPVVAALLKVKANANKADEMGRSPLHVTASSGGVDVARLLISAGAETDKFDKTFMTPFVAAVNSNNADVLRVLVDAGCDRSTIDGLNGTAIALAALKGHDACVKALLEANEDPDEFGFFSFTPLMSACYESHANVVNTLLLGGADPGVKSRMALTALIVAMSNVNQTNAVSRHRIICRLLQGGADVNQHINPMDPYFVTTIPNRSCPLSFALKRGLTAIVRILLLAGSDVTCAEIRKWLSSYSAQSPEYKDIKNILLDHKMRPIPLRQICRLAIRKSLGWFPHRKIQFLPVAPPLKEYLLLRDLDMVEHETACLSEDLPDPMTTTFVTVSPCSLAALEGTFLHETISEPVMQSATQPCTCDVCKKITAMLKAEENEQ